MKAKSTSISGFFTFRALILLLLCAAIACSILAGTMLAFSRRETAREGSHSTVAALTFEERVSYQRAIEEVYWRHRIWPRERPDSKPSLDAVMSQAQLEKKVGDYLRNSQALQDYWQRPITAEQLKAEMDRMAQHTKQPEVLRELFAALGNDPFVIAECVARPALAERLLTNWYAYDQRFHGELKQRAEADLRTHSTIEQMKQTSGKYSEIEMVRSDGALKAANRDAGRSVKLDSREWDETVRKLAAMFGNGHPVAAGLSPARITQIKTGVLSALQEDERRYYATAVLSETEGSLKIATVAWLKEPVQSWRARTENQTPVGLAAPSASYALPEIAAGGCVDDTWTTTAGPPDSHGTAVWTGSEMIVWGGAPSSNTGARYNPGTDSWTATSTINAPDPRQSHTAVWTGNEMIIWGGSDGNPLNTGGRYNPGTDSWTPTSTTNAPEGRYSHTAVLAGSEMIVWGGFHNSPDLNTGGRYNPGTDSWTATNTANAPSGRAGHTAVWSGSEMIVWGGGNSSSFTLNTGGKYNPGTDSWTATDITNAPIARTGHTAVWTGSEMIVWGGFAFVGSRFDNPLAYVNTGGRYNPDTDSWTATSTANAPDGRWAHTAVWTGSEMIVWGGSFHDTDKHYVNTGGRYNPSTDGWTATTTSNAPSARGSHTAVWTGSEMIVWGGFDGTSDLNTGERYDPGTDSWTPTGTNNAPTARENHRAVWTGNEMIVWGGFDGGLSYFNTGGTYNPGTDSWTATSTVNAPEERYYHTAVWTGTEMIIWGGSFYDGSFHYLNTGGRYEPGTDSWTATSTVNAPDPRSFHTAVWTGNEMIIWGGSDNSSLFNIGGKYSPNTDSWVATSTANAPDAREGHTAVWSGSEMIVWGGGCGFMCGAFNTGGRYDPGTDSWTITSTVNAPGGRGGHTALWTSNEMIVWGGVDFRGFVLNTGGKYDSSTDSWTETSTTNAPSARVTHTAVWTGSEMIVWGGDSLGGAANTGGRYCAQSGPTPRTTPTPRPRPTPAPRP